ncbi:MAG: SDR family NAD(P)-dependent oxidoreductase, partial [Bacillales bacterium]
MTTAVQQAMEITQYPNLKGKIAIVTGGSRGIGSAIAKELAKRGVEVVFNYNLSKDAADSVIEE